jgi:hypothetical protein
MLTSPSGLDHQRQDDRALACLLGEEAREVLAGLLLQLFRVADALFRRPLHYLRDGGYRLADQTVRCCWSTKLRDITSGAPRACRPARSHAPRR